MNINFIGICYLLKYLGYFVIKHKISNNFFFSGCLDGAKASSLHNLKINATF